MHWCISRSYYNSVLSLSQMCLLADLTDALNIELLVAAIFIFYIMC